jgi:hypothetical protein
MTLSRYTTSYGHILLHINAFITESYSVTASAIMYFGYVYSLISNMPIIHSYVFASWCVYHYNVNMSVDHINFILLINKR